MSLELIYTSAPRGLKPNSSGFCTVAATGGMSRQVMMKLESLSGYELRFNLSDPNAELNPVNFSHTRIEIGSETLSVLSRIGFSGADYSGRTNKIAHHFLLGRDELGPAGPARVLAEMAAGVFRTSWDEGPKELPPRALDALLAGAGQGQPRPAAQWQRAAGDAGWAGALVRAFRENRKVPAYVIYQPGMDILPLLVESLALLPPPERWSVCFSTYYTSLPSGCQYHWRGVLAESTAAREIGRYPDATVIDLTAPLPAPEEGPYTEAARAGHVVPLAQVAPGGVVNIQEALASPAGERTGPDEAGGEEKIYPLAAEGDSRLPAAAAAAGPHVRDPFQQPVTVIKRSPGLRVLSIALGILAVALLAWNLWLMLTGASLREEFHQVKSDLARARTDLARAEEARSNSTARLKSLTTRAADLDKQFKRIKQERDDLGRKLDADKALIAKLKSHKSALQSERDKYKNQLDRIKKEMALAGSTPRSRPSSPTSRAALDGRLGKQFEGKISRSKVNEYKKSVRYPHRSEKREYHFRVGHAVGFLELPGPMKRCLGVKLLREANVLEYSHETALMKQSRLRCKLSQDARSNVLTCEITKDACTQAKYRAEAESVVVEVVDHKARRVYQCVLGRSKVPESKIVLGFVPDDGKIRVVDSGQIAFDYPWPNRLALGGAAFGKSRFSILAMVPKGLRWPKKKTFPWITKQQKFSLALQFDKVEITKKPPAVTMTATVNVVKEIEGLAKQKNKQKDDLDGKLQDIDEMWGKFSDAERIVEKDAYHKKREDVETKIEPIKAALKRIRRQMDSIKQCLESKSPIELFDAWGVPIKHIKLEFKTCDPKLIRPKPK